ncbi:MAG: methylated-DNA--[protein]-cysteine S-methyltransferase [Eggerthellaceae bacterium]|nr:methylated-DNA--[protein]-cysteine S-methyltransferase [Eggerthellaceae bacterium]MDR2715717.1 methylated-DNA--[protein]-cysteine S-methyltransferase [Coriobacteriaceae bacterium]
MQFVSTIPSPVGDLTLGSDGEHLSGLWLAEQKYFMANVGKASQEDNLPVFEEARAWLDRYFAGEDPGPIPPVKMPGTAFQQRVWDLLVEIPYGKLTTYGEIARRIAAERGMEKMSSRAVGGAVGHNPVSIIVPCHRVVGASGSLTGYGGGLARKIKLLELEGVDMSRLSIPTKGTAL